MLGAVQAGIVPAGRVLYGPELVDTMNTDVGIIPSGIWGQTGNNTIELDGENGTKITYVDTDFGYTALRQIAGLSSNLVIGKRYLFSVEAKAQGSVSITIQNGSGIALSSVFSVDTETFELYKLWFTAVNTASSIFQHYSLGSGKIVWFRNMSLKEVY